MRALIFLGGAFAGFAPVAVLWATHRDADVERLEREAVALRLEASRERTRADAAESRTRSMAVQVDTLRRELMAAKAQWWIPLAFDDEDAARIPAPKVPFPTN